MPLLRLTGTEAVANLRSNPNAQWPTREIADANRIEPLCMPAFKPSFVLEPGEKIFTIGSCFARNVEYGLVKRGFDVVTSSLAWPDRSIDILGNAVLNNYGVVSIENEFRWALDPQHPFDPAKHILELAPDRYIDPHIPARPAPLEKILQYRAAITGVTKRVEECRVVIMTLGLSELWYDAETATYLNRAPPRMLLTRHPGRFELHLLDFDDTMRSLQAALALLETHCRPDQRVLMTVSPVPISTTHTDDDVLVVNSYSKAVLRTACEHISAKNSRVEYFPSYESVVMSVRSEAWEDDQVHVRGPLVALNVERMLKAYMPGVVRAGPVDVKRLLLEAEEEMAAQNPIAAAAVLEPLRDAVELEAGHATRYAELCLRLGRLDDARAAMTKLAPSAGEWRRELIEARLALHDGEGDKALAILDRLAEAQPKVPAVLRARIDAFEQLGRFEDALVVLNYWAAMPRSPIEPFRRAAAIHRARGDAVAAEHALRRVLATAKADDHDVLDFVEFLLEQNRLDEAARELGQLKPESRAALRRLERLRALLPTVRD